MDGWELFEKGRGSVRGGEGEVAGWGTMEGEKVLIAQVPRSEQLAF